MDNNIVSFPEIEANGSFCLTPTAEAIFDSLAIVVETARDQLPGLGLIVGPPGVGKTIAIREFAERFNGKAIIYTAMCGRSAIKDTLVGLIEAVKGSRYWVPTRTSEALDILINYLEGNNCNPKPDLIIIDEAQELEPKSLDCLRQVHDMTGVPLVFCGNPYLSRMVNGRTAAASFAQIRSRLASCLIIESSIRDDVEAIARLHGITNKEAIGVLTEIAQSDGNLRSVAIVVNQAGKLTGSARAITAKHVKQIAIARGVRWESRK
jgi:DNA transposition AAA+ family ATPase